MVSCARTSPSGCNRGLLGSLGVRCVAVLRLIACLLVIHRSVDLIAQIQVLRALQGGVEGAAGGGAGAQGGAADGAAPAGERRRAPGQARAPGHRAAQGARAHALQGAGVRAAGSTSATTLLHFFSEQGTAGVTRKHNSRAKVLLPVHESSTSLRACRNAYQPATPVPLRRACFPGLSAALADRCSSNTPFGTKPYRVMGVRVLLHAPPDDGKGLTDICGLHLASPEPRILAGEPCAAMQACTFSSWLPR